VDRSIIPVERYTGYHWADAKPDMAALRGSKGIIVDFKTGKWNPRFAEDKILQVTFYAALIMDRYPSCQEVLGLVYHPVGEQPGVSSVVVQRNSPEHLNIYEEIAYLRHALDLYTEHGQTEQFYKNKNNFCGTCPVRDCEFNGGK
jgi:hypothetical protein